MFHRHLVRSLAAAAAFALSARVVSAQALNPQDVQDAIAVRAEITSEYAKWGKARLAHDRATFDQMLAPDFWVQPQPDGPKLERATFIDRIARTGAGPALVRFESHILTLQHLADGTWVAVITEKLEGNRTTPDGATVRSASLWITRDGWKKVDGQWRIGFSQGVGTQVWPTGNPPFADWGSAQ
ncbi:MAG: hypothetical protein JWO05_3668 [Gemmatimonadetes bacterium]|nr:hypothetical protein [Gemmatimonadota bacterium]